MYEFKITNTKDDSSSYYSPLFLFSFSFLLFLVLFPLSLAVWPYTPSFTCKSNFSNSIIFECLLYRSIKLHLVQRVSNIYFILLLQSYIWLGMDINYLQLNLEPISNELHGTTIFSTCNIISLITQHFLLN